MNDAEVGTIILILTRHGAKRIALFGSYARGEATAESDIDILAEFSDRKSLLDLVGIELELKEALNAKVDLLTRKSISPYLIDSIERQAKVVYG